MRPKPPECIAMLKQADVVSQREATTQRDSAVSVFPLPLTPFEYYYLLEDRCDYPAVFEIHLECRGRLNRAAFAKAYHLAHARHPLLSARLEKAANGWPQWVAGERPPIRWKADAPPPREMFDGVPVSPRLAVSVNESGERSRIIFNFHHVAVDGMGGFMFITDLMVAYAHYSGGEPGDPSLRTLMPALLRDRNEHTLFRRGFSLSDLPGLARVSVPLLLQRVARVEARGAQASDDTVSGRVAAEPCKFLIHTLDADETAELSSVAQSQEVRLHELLLRDYFLTLAEWNRETSQRRLPIRVLVPVNLRRREHLRMPAANIFGYTFLARRIADCADPRALLASIGQEMTSIKSTRRAQYYEAGLRLSCIWPRMLRKSLERKNPFATAVFTNLNGGFDRVPLPWGDGGRVVGDIVVENGYGAGPIRPDTRLSLAVHNYADRLSLCLRYDEHVFAADEPQAFLQAYLDQLRMTRAARA